ncbi:MAG TPA: radical SAM protein, partial [Candidatus Dormibacteraeota bacterium]|nr:radical SAM protein [Candidatus Dormibacteraeota bacterium]
MARLYIETFGCQMNEADSAEIAQRATAAGYAIVTRAEDAQVLLLNTCTVRDNAERRAYGRMNHFRALMNADAKVRLVVMGCLAEQDRDRMAKLAPHVDAIYGTKELRALGDTLERWHEEFDEDPDVEAIEQRALLAPMGGSADGILDAFSHLRSFVNVQRGCSYYCTFCIVPQVRGRFDHRPASDILTEVEGRVASGAREVMLVGQTVNAWHDPATGDDFLALVRRVSAVPGLERLTFISPHPKDFSEATIAGFAQVSALNPRIHLPLQS